MHLPRWSASACDTHGALLYAALAPSGISVALAVRGRVLARLAIVAAGATMVGGIWVRRIVLGLWGCHIVIVVAVDIMINGWVGVGEGGVSGCGGAVVLDVTDG